MKKLIYGTDQVCNSTECVPFCNSENCTNNNNLCETSGICTCGGSTACTGDEVCDGTKCIPACNSSTICTVNGYICNETTHLCDCNGNICGEGQQCNGNSCGAPDNICAGNHCYYGKCVTSASACSATIKCLEYETQDCINGACISKPAAYGCDPGCADFYKCESGKCTPNGDPLQCQTQSNVACPSGMTCSSRNLGISSIPSGCQYNTELYSCASNNDCSKYGDESICINGYCSCGNVYPAALFSEGACIGGFAYGLTCPEKGMINGENMPLHGYVCNGTVFSCGGAICAYGEVCVNNTCVISSA